MGRWNPPSNVGPNEQIGRRKFDEPMLKGVKGQPPFSGSQLYHFEETRDREISLDRLGASGIDQKVFRYLLPRAEAASGKFAKPKHFDGWFVFSAKELANPHKGPSLAVHASPVNDPEPDDNIYHAHVVRPANYGSYEMALHLRYVWETCGKKIGQNKSQGASFWGRFCGSILSLVGLSPDGSDNFRAR
jgi:hypothetical protein